MKKLLTIAAIAMMVSLTASAFTVNPAYNTQIPGGYDYATVQDFQIGKTQPNDPANPEMSLLDIYNKVADSVGGAQAADWAALMALSVDPDQYANGEPGAGPGGPQGLFNGQHDVTFEARYAGAQHRLFVEDGDGSEVQLTGLPVSGNQTPAAGIPIGTVTPGQAGLFADIDNPWDLRLDVTNWRGSHSVSTDRLVNLNNGNTGHAGNGIFALIFTIAGVPNTYVIAFEDLLDRDFDYNDLVLTASIVPVPPAMALIALGMGGVALMRARRRKS